MPFDTPRQHRIGQLRRRLQTLIERYGPVESGLDGLDRLNLKVDRRRMRIRHLTARIAEMQAEIATLEKERDGYLVGVEALLADLIVTIEQRHPEGWSPLPIPGYRMWNIDHNLLTGVVMPWRDRTKEASCLNRVPGEDLPHSNGRCGPPACGIYATKACDHIFSQMNRRRDWAIGLVGMSGKVVEHRLGYRAQRATIEALCLVVEGRSLHLADPLAIEAALLDPKGVAAAGTPAHADFAELRRAMAFLEEHERSTRWTLENKNG